MERKSEFLIIQFNFHLRYEPKKRRNESRKCRQVSKAPLQSKEGGEAEEAGEPRLGPVDQAAGAGASRCEEVLDRRPVATVRGNQTD